MAPPSEDQGGGAGARTLLDPPLNAGRVRPWRCTTLRRQGCIKLLTPPSGEVFIKSVGEEYQVVKGGKKYQGCGEEYNVEKREGEAILFVL